MQTPPTSHQASLALAAPAATPQPKPSKAAALLQAAEILLVSLETGAALSSSDLRNAMTLAFGASDSQGAWFWKDAYDAVEAAQLLFVRKYLPSMRAAATDPAAILPMLESIASKLPTHTRRSEESLAFQQFSTPLPLAFILSCAGAITPADLVLEPSAGTGQLAVFAETARARLALNELAATRADLLAALFPKAPVTRFNAEQINDYLHRAARPSLVLMNPPFSAQAGVTGSVTGVDLRHVRSSLARLLPGGRLVAITSAGAVPSAPTYKAAFEDITKLGGKVVFSAGIDGKLYRRHGTTIDTRLTVIDRIPALAEEFNPFHDAVQSAEELLRLLEAHLPPRAAIETPADLSAPQLSLFSVKPGALAASASPQAPAPLPAVQEVPPPELDYEAIDAGPATAACGETLYEPYALESIRIPAAKPHSDTLVQSAAMASVRPPKPSYKPHMPTAIVEKGILSDAQLESVVYAGEAHASHLAGRWLVNETGDVISLAPEGSQGAVQFRRGWYLGDGTGVGKGRQVAGIILDNWLKGRRRALWISKSDKLLEDAQRDWKALGRERLQIVPLDRFKLGAPVTLSEGILFTTYATLRSDDRAGKRSRLSQITDWLGEDFDGVIIFDEAHAMANAAGGKSERGDKKPSQQGLAGLKLQHKLPDARVVYVSATGATDVQNLAYAQRLGLWGSEDFPFATRAEFISAMHQGGIAAMEVLARDLKALGLYTARSLSFAGVEVDILEHALTPDQIKIYDAYAGAFQIIHHNLNDALKAANVTSDTGTLNKDAKAAARSAFESNKQRFFNHLITAMKMPTLLHDIETHTDHGHAAVIQLVSTSESLMERRLANIPASEWGDLQIDCSPREYVLSYLQTGFPTQLYETYTDENGNKRSRPVVEGGQPLHCADAIARRDALIEHLAALPPVQSALDQLIHHFGTDSIAEITGRSRRIVKKLKDGHPVMALHTRPPSSNTSEAQAFMDDKKKILVFSRSGGTGRSYHADRSCKNTRKRIHYLLEAGWQADEAIQGLGRSNRTNQAQPPLFRPVATDVRGEKRFLSTIARRLDTLGAITRGQRQTGGQGMFRPEDNLESPYARTALRQLYQRLFEGKVACCSLLDFQNATGLTIKSEEDGCLLDRLPPVSTFLNRVLALPIALQNQLFEEFEALLAAIVEGAIAGGTYEIGLETIRAESLKILSRRIIAEHEATGAQTLLLEVQKTVRNEPITADAALSILAANQESCFPVFNEKSGRVGISLPASHHTDEDGMVHARCYLLRPLDRELFTLSQFMGTHWRRTDTGNFAALWQTEVDALPEFNTSTFHIATGLLLPIWNRLPEDNPRVYRFQTDDFERVIGRLIPPQSLQTFGVSPALASGSEAAALLQRGVTLQLIGGMSLKKVLVMHEHRLELRGFSPEALPLLKSYGLNTEIIDWKTRAFIPISGQTDAILERILSRYPLQAQSQSEAA